MATTETIELVEKKELSIDRRERLRELAERDSLRRDFEIVREQRKKVKRTNPK